MPSPLATAKPHPDERPPHAPLPEAVSDRLGFLLGKNHRALRGLADEALRPFGLEPGETDCNPSHVGCLAVIASEAPLSQQRLGELTGIDRTSVVAIVDYLERHGYVERRRNPDDRRAYLLLVTDAGRKWLAAAKSALIEVEDRYLGPLSGRERAQLKDLLRKLIVR
jgi:MarR family transcriptional regulator, lower aerobic nicotinate degradation pathway regulator